MKLGLVESSYEIDAESSTDVLIRVNTFSPNSARASCETCVDKFLYYSNDETRINTLKFGETESQKTESNQSNDQQRKTKISFEICPLLMMADMMDEF